MSDYSNTHKYMNAMNSGNYLMYCGENKDECSTDSTNFKCTKNPITEKDGYKFEGHVFSAACALAGKKSLFSMDKSDKHWNPFPR